MNTQSQINTEQLTGLRSRLHGDFILPGDAEYDTTRAIWNGMIDRKPGGIICCKDEHDVIAGVNFARENNLVLAIKGGGHNVAGNAVCDNGLMLDLSGLNAVTVYPSTQTVRVGGGSLLHDVDVETQKYGLAVSAGIVSHTGVGGLTLGGGFGWISRKHGLSIDNLISAKMVTADGSLLNVDKDNHPDLFWGIRGGGGNFGVVTEFQFQCADIGTEVYSGMIVHRFEDARSYMQFHAEYVRTLPDEMTAWMVIRHAPPLPFLDASVHGQRVVIVPFVYLGDPAEGEVLINPIRNFGKPLGEAIGMNPWVDWQAGFDGLNSHGARNYWKSHHLKNLSTPCIETVLEYARNLPTQQSEIFIPHMEGAPSRVPEDATAYSHRKPPFVLNIHTRWDSPAEDDQCLHWARNLFNETKQYANGVYVNFLSDEGKQRVRDAYPNYIWDRLIQLKNKYDPLNLFRMNQNIPPSA